MVVLMDGDTVLGPKLLRHTLPFFNLLPKLGGLTTNTVVLASDDFKKATPFNQTFSDSVPFLKDFYNVPKYAELLEATQIHWNKCVTGGETPQQAMDTIADKHTEILTASKILP